MKKIRLKKMIPSTRSEWRCTVGLHYWTYSSTNRRYCICCGKRQTYDRHHTKHPEWGDV